MPKIPQNISIKSNPKSKTQREVKKFEVEELLSSPLQIHSGILALENEIDGSTKVKIYADLLTYS